MFPLMRATPINDSGNKMPCDHRLGGDVTLQLATLIGPQGRVVGLDIDANLTGREQRPILNHGWTPMDTDSEWDP